jgi:hypothetical protein
LIDEKLSASRVTLLHILYDEPRAPWPWRAGEKISWVICCELENALGQQLEARESISCRGFFNKQGRGRLIDFVTFFLFISDAPRPKIHCFCTLLRRGAECRKKLLDFYCLVFIAVNPRWFSALSFIP